MVNQGGSDVKRNGILKLNVVLGLLLSLIFSCEGEKTARFIKEVEYMGKGYWMKADTHVHTKFSDGKYYIEKIAAEAIAQGCDIIAITDHSDRDEDAATPEYFENLEAARKAYPELLILSGAEWNIPPYGGDEHATLLLDNSPNSAKTLMEFKERFDDLKRDTHDTSLTREALEWLPKQKEAGFATPLVLLNHPSRKRKNSTDIVADIRWWRSINHAVVGFSGAPGHQRAGKFPLCSYQYDVKPVDRWDPAAATIGDAWDMLLQEGINIWGARAPSDFHSDNPKSFYDFWPGEFSETWLYVPEKTTTGAMRALRAGTFFAAHGQIVREVILTVSGEGLRRPAFPGEQIAATEGMELQVELNYELPAEDWKGNPNKIDEIELIGISEDGARSLYKKSPSVHRIEFSEKIVVPDGGIVIRARGRSIQDGEPDWLFYTNPIRIFAD